MKVTFGRWVVPGEGHGIERDKRLAILVNTIAPYRVPIYESLARRFDVAVYVSGEEGNHPEWGPSVAGQGLRVRTSWGVTIELPVHLGGQVFDRRNLHITPGYIWDLIRYRPDAVVTTEMGFRTLVALSYGAVARKPVWVWWGGTPHTERARHPIKRVVRWVMARWVRRWISYGGTSTEYLLQLGVARERILQVQNCVDEAHFSKPIAPLVDLAPKPVLLYVGQMIGRKGVDHLLDAAAAVQSEGFEFSLLLVGGGPDGDRLRARADELGLKHVHFLGAQPPDVMPAVYRSGDCLIFPTLEDVWGLVVNEALWSGLPVACSIYAGCAEEIVPAENQFDPHDPDDFVRVLRRAVRGKLVPADTSPLLTAAEVAKRIGDDIAQALAR